MRDINVNFASLLNTLTTNERLAELAQTAHSIRAAAEGTCIFDVG